MAAHSTERPWLSVVVPTLNEAAGIETMLAPLQPWRSRGVEVVLVDGGSGDGTVSRARSLVDQCLTSESGRAMQMNAGACRAGAPLLWFLHADTGIDDTHIEALQAVHGTVWGRFDVRLSGDHTLLRVVEWFMNQRSRLTGIATGDQGMFVEADSFRAVGGFPSQPLMEDVALSRLLRRRQRPFCVRVPVRVDSRKWEREGVWRTIVLMWRLRWLYWRGVDPAALHRRYYRVNR